MSYLKIWLFLVIVTFTCCIGLETTGRTASVPCNNTTSINKDTNIEILIISGREKIDRRWAKVLNSNSSTIKTMNITRCMISNLEMLNFDEFVPNLECLVLSDLDLKEVNFYALANLPRLSRLMLDNNFGLMNLTGEMKVNLESLTLSNTSFEDVPLKSLAQFNSSLFELNITRFDGKEFATTEIEVCSKLVNLRNYNQHDCNHLRKIQKEGVRTSPPPTLQRSQAPPPPSAPTKSSSANMKNLPLVLLLPIILSSLSFVKHHHFVLSMITLVLFASSGLAQSPDTIIKSDQHIKHISNMLFAPYEKTPITDVSLDNNDIETIDYDAFESLPNLSELSLSNNKITSINFMSERLQYLNLGNNIIATVSDKSFVLLPSLFQLILSNNRLTQINWDLSPLQDITIVDLSNNPELKEVRIQSDTLEALSLSYNKIHELDLQTPRLRVLHFLFAEFTNGGLSNICKRHNTMTFKISYIREDTDKTDFYECFAEDVGEMVQALVEDERPEVPAVAGCEFSTLKANIGNGDVLLTKHEFFMVEVYIAVLCSTIIALLILLLYVLLRLAKFRNAIIANNQDRLKCLLV